jgi:hypothetical protein
MNKESLLKIFKKKLNEIDYQKKSKYLMPFNEVSIRFDYKCILRT